MARGKICCLNRRLPCVTSLKKVNRPKEKRGSPCGRQKYVEKNLQKNVSSGTYHGDFGLGENGFGMVGDHIVSGDN